MSIHGIPEELSEEGREAAESIPLIEDNEIPRVVDKKFEKGAAHETMDRLNSRKAFKTEVPDSLDIGTDVTISASANQVKDIGNRDGKEFLRPLIEFDDNGTQEPFYTKRSPLVPSGLQPLDTEFNSITGNKYTLNIQAPVDAIDRRWEIRMKTSITNVRLRVYRGIDATGVLIYENVSEDTWLDGGGFNWEGESPSNPLGDNTIDLKSELDIRGGDVEFVLIEWTGTQTFSIKGFDFGAPTGFIPYIETYFFNEEETPLGIGRTVCKANEFDTKSSYATLSLVANTIRQLSFEGAAKATPNASIDAAGVTTILVDGCYEFDLFLNIDTTTGTNTSVFKRILVDGVQVGNTIQTTFVTNNDSDTTESTTILELTAGQEVIFEVYANTNSSRLIQVVPLLSGWAMSEGETLRVSKLVTVA